MLYIYRVSWIRGRFLGLGMVSCTYYLFADMTFFKHNCGQILELKVKIVLFLKKFTYRFIF